jgi:hypothetical protein
MGRAAKGRSSSHWLEIAHPENMARPISLATRSVPRAAIYPQILLAALCVTRGRPHQVLDALQLTRSVPVRGNMLIAQAKVTDLFHRFR